MKNLVQGCAIIGGIIVIIGVISFFYMGSKVADTMTEEKTFEYVVTGTSGSYGVTLSNGSGDFQQWESVGNDWHYMVKTTGTALLSISAQNNKDFGNVTVKILQNGVVIKQNTSYGGYQIATVSGVY